MFKNISTKIKKTFTISIAEEEKNDKNDKNELNATKKEENEESIIDNQSEIISEDDNFSEKSEENEKFERKSRFSKRKGLTTISMKVKLKRNIQDLQALDINQRTILHRSALQQKLSLIKDIISDFKIIIYQSNDINENVDRKTLIKNYINRKDKFGNSPLLNSCSLDLEGSSTSRPSCISILLENGADPMAMNKRTKWTPIFWISYWGDEESAKLLLSYNVCLYEPDYLGYYPLDLAGKNNKLNIVQMILENLILKLEIYESDKVENPDTYNKFLECSILRLSMLYWGCFSKQDVKVISKILNFFDYFEAPNLLVHKMSCFHVCAQRGNYEALCLLFENLQDKYEKIYKKLQHKIIKKTFTFNLNNNNILNFNNIEKKQYNKKYLGKIKRFSKWIFIFEKTLKLNFLPEDDFSFKKMKKFFDQPDLYGNTALHLASMVGRGDIVRLLIKKGANIDYENKEGYRPKELVQIEEIRLIYSKEVEELSKEINDIKIIRQSKSVVDFNKAMVGEINKKIKTIKSDSQNISKEIRSMTLKKNNLHSAIMESKLSKLEKLCLNKTNYVPDFIIKFSARTSTGFFSSKIESEMQNDRINFYVQLLLNAKFEVLLCKSLDNKYFYAMLKLPENELENQCMNLKIPIKLIDSYNYETYSKKNKANFEPFRSRQRQEIIYYYIQKILDLEMLIKENLVISYFLMHSYSGISKIRKKWINDPRCFWPQPLDQIDDYLLEGKDQNFSSVTYLRQYFGEKITFFIAWKSFVTCFLLFIGIPGLALHIYIIYYDNYYTRIQPFWVFYVSLWATFILEFWKRKSSEINSRWGSLLESLENSDSKIIRKEFSGDETVSQTTGHLTKFYKKSQTYLYFFITLPILIFLLFCCVGSFLVIDYIKTNYAKNNTTIKIILGLFYGIIISVLNIIYTMLAKKFVNMENHMYISGYENSLIIKICAFKFLNSFFSVFYTAFVKGEELENVFIMIFPLLVTNVFSRVLVDVFLPFISYKYYQRKYFKLIKSKSDSQNRNSPPSAEDFDPIAEMIGIKNNNQFIEFFRRAILRLDTNENDFLNDVIIDFAELNSLRSNFNNLIDNYADSFIAFGYITMFAAAFPSGPIIALFLQIFDIRCMINGFLYVYKRPLCEKCTGIGLWNDIWEVMSLVCVVTNFLLLYTNRKADFKVFYKDSTGGVGRLWTVIIIVVIIVLCKYFFRFIIPDKPQWVKEEEKRLKSKRELDLGKGKSNLQDIEFMYTNKIKKMQKKQKEFQMEFLKTLQKKENELSKINILLEKVEKKPEKIIVLEKNPKKISPIEFKCKIYGIFRYTYIEVENELLYQRFNQFNLLSKEGHFICNECHENLAIFDCINCNENFCKQCYDNLHEKIIETKNHLLYLLDNPNKENKNKLLEKNYKIISSNYEDRMDYYYQQEKEELKNSMKKQKTIKENTDLLNVKGFWKKFENFSFPIIKESPFFNDLINSFDLLYKIYLLNNGVYKDKNIIDFNSFLKYDYEPALSEEIGNERETTLKLPILKEIKGSCHYLKNYPLSLFLKLKSFSVEDKLFLNRIANICFRKLGAQANFKEFLKYCKILQEGNYIQKVVLFLDFLDDGSGMINRFDMRKMFVSSFVKDMDFESSIDHVLQSIFQKEIEEEKKVVVEPIVKNVAVKKLFRELLQSFD